MSYKFRHVICLIMGCISIFIQVIWYSIIMTLPSKFSYNLRLMKISSHLMNSETCMKFHPFSHVWCVWCIDYILIVGFPNYKFSFLMVVGIVRLIHYKGSPPTENIAIAFKDNRLAYLTLSLHYVTMQSTCTRNHPRQLRCWFLSLCENNGTTPPTIEISHTRRIEN